MNLNRFFVVFFVFLFCIQSAMADGVALGFCSGFNSTPIDISDEFNPCKNVTACASGCPRWYMACGKTTIQVDGQRYTVKNYGASFCPSKTSAGNCFFDFDSRNIKNQVQSATSNDRIEFTSDGKTRVWPPNTAQGKVYEGSINDSTEELCSNQLNSEVNKLIASDPAGKKFYYGCTNCTCANSHFYETIPPVTTPTPTPTPVQTVPPTIRPVATAVAKTVVLS